MVGGSGVPMKVLEAWAAGLPVVAHPWAAAGLDAAAREALAVAGSPDEWHAALTRLLADPSEAARLGERGRELWRRSYHPERVDERLRAAIAACGA
jgi:glycosyltransferase involved in cell wall biosynthesis